MSYAISIIDAFADQPFSGNQAAICLLTDSNQSDQWMQNLAAEMNLSETAFLTKREDGSWQLRWFTPTVEINLCGHATLAAAHALWELHGETSDTLLFHTRSGELTAKRTENGIQLDFPVTQISEFADSEHGAIHTQMIDALNLSTQQLPANQIFQANEDLLIMLDSTAAVEALQPDMAALITLNIRGVIVTAAGGRDGVDFTSRFFAPGAGINEDPVTGATHCALAPFWSARLGKQSMRGYQASTRGGYVGVTLQGARVLLEGQAITMIKGETCG